jgi:hypothetical protein
MALTTRQTNDLNGIDPILTAAQYAAAASDPARVQLLIDAIQPLATQANRGFYDMMPEVVRIQLLQDLTILKAGVT